MWLRRKTSKKSQLSEGSGKERETPPWRDQNLEHDPDELLSDPPMGEHHRGRFTGLQAGFSLRLKLLLFAGAVTVTLIVLAHRGRAQNEWQRMHPFQLSEEARSEARPRALTWTEGKVRLGLNRRPPGLLMIHLPDRDLELAEDCEHAQFDVEVKDGVTIKVEIIYGEIKQRLITPQEAP